VYISTAVEHKTTGVAGNPLCFKNSSVRAHNGRGRRIGCRACRSRYWRGRTWGGGYVNMWSGIGAALKDNQAVANLVSKLHQQVKVNTGNVGTAMAKANQANSDAAALKTQLVGMFQTQWSEEENLTQVNGQLYQLTLILNQTQKDFRQNNLAPPLLPGAGVPGIGPVMVNGVCVEDAVAQLQL
jgi:hypothetical protein